jgi:Protein of unknown function (DUF1350)
MRGMIRRFVACFCASAALISAATLSLTAPHVCLQMSASPFRANIDSALQSLRSFSPEAAKVIDPLLQQLSPVFTEVAEGRQDFSPTPEEADRLIRAYYNVRRNLLISFEDDSIDETERLRAILANEAGISGSAELTVRMLPGDHVRPMSANVVELPPEVAKFANDAAKSSGAFIGMSRSMRMHCNACKREQVALAVSKCQHASCALTVCLQKHDFDTKIPRQISMQEDCPILQATWDLAKPEVPCKILVAKFRTSLLCLVEVAAQQSQAWL